MFLEQRARRRDARGRLGVVRNGYQPERGVVTGIGPVTVRLPKVRDRAGGGAVFRSSLVPPYVRRTRSLEAALPWLYLKDIFTRNMSEAQQALVGQEAVGLFAAVVSRLRARWNDEYELWKKRSLAQERWVYLWADGIYSGLRAEDTRVCLLGIIGVNVAGAKTLPRHPGRGTRIYRVLARAAVGVEGALACGSGQACRGRRGACILGRVGRGLSRNASATLLGAQEGQCAELPAPLGAAKGEIDAARDLDG